MAQTPLISICVPNLNKRPFLAERIETLLAQTVADWEMIVCDSYSNDGSWELLQKFKHDRRIQLHQIPRHGLYAGWNECLRRATGQYIYIATSDDTAKPQLLEKLLEPLERRPSIDLAFCDYFEIDERSEQIADRLTTYKKFVGNALYIPCVRNGNADFLIHANFGPAWMTMTTVLFRRSLLNKTGLFPTNRGSFGDFRWALRSALATDSAFVPGQWASFRVSASQATPQKPNWRQCRNNILCIRDVLDDAQAPICDAWKSVAGWRDKILRSANEQFLDSFELYRWALRQNPVKFVTDVAGSIVHAPSFLAKQALRAFATRPQLDLIANANDLLQTFGVPWPPQKVAQW